MQGERGLLALEAVREVAHRFGLPVGEVKPCVALLLDGNLGEIERHTAAFIVAIELRRIGLVETKATELLNRWAHQVEYRSSDVRRAIMSAYGRRPNGEWRYWPPGRVKRPGSRYAQLEPTCCEVGCPAQCPPLASRGMRSETFSVFGRHGWPVLLRRERRGAAVDVYRAVCEFEERVGLPPGAPVRASHAQLAELAGRSRQNIGGNLVFLHERGLLERLVLGSGSGPRAHDRVATELARVVPIPTPNPPIKHRARGVPIDRAPERPIYRAPAAQPETAAMQS